MDRRDPFAPRSKSQPRVTLAALLAIGRVTGTDAAARGPWLARACSWKRSGTSRWVPPLEGGE